MPTIEWPVRCLLAALVAACTTAPVVGRAQVAPERQAVEQQELPAAAETTDSSSGEPTGEDYRYVLPAADAWTLRTATVSDETHPVIVAPVDGLDGAVSQTPASPQDAAIIDKALALDAAEFAAIAPKSLRAPAGTQARTLDISRNATADGYSAVSIKKPLPIAWDAKVGADLNLPATAPVGYHLANPAGVTPYDSGAAWASVSVPDIATVDARVDPNSDQGRIGTAFERSIPFGNRFTVKLRSYYSLTEILPQSPTVPSDGAAAHVRANEHMAKLAILPTGTTLGAGINSASDDPVTHNTLSAEQNIYGPLNVTTAVTDIGHTSVSKSVSAGFKVSW